MEYSIQGSQGNFSFFIAHDLTTPCAHCGVPSCGEEAFLWYEENGQRITLIYDGPALEHAILEYFDKSEAIVEAAPSFLRDFYLDTGWAEWDHPDGFVIDIGSFIEAITVIARTLEGVVAEEIINLMPHLISHAQMALEKERSLRIYHS